MTYDFRERTASSKKPLYGHDSPQSAYVIDDYPSGFRARCRKRVWLEYKARSGWRLVEQTSEKWYPGEEPAKDAELSWNKPKASTYSDVAACMYLDAQDHVQYDALSMHTSASHVAEFMKEFPKADFSGIKVCVIFQAKYLVSKLKGATWVVNGEPQPVSDHELGEVRKNLEAWSEIGKEVGVKFAQPVLDLIEGKVAPTKVDPEAVKAQIRQEEAEAAAARTEEAKNTPGAMSAAQFVEALQSKINAEGRVVRIDGKVRGTGQIYVNFYNIPAGEAKANRGGGAEAENNRQMFVIGGFDRKDDNALAAKVKVELSVNSLSVSGMSYAEAKAKTTLRAKTGSPAKIAEYLAAHINRMVKEIEPRLTHAKFASYDYGTL